MEVVIAFGQSLKNKYPAEFIRMAYVIFRNESANGYRGVNNNYGGIQADDARWRDLPGQPIATCVKIDSGGKERRFLCFAPEDGYKICFEFACIKSQQRNMRTADDYFAKWVGNKVQPVAAYDNFNSMMKQASGLFLAGL